MRAEAAIRKEKEEDFLPPRPSAKQMKEMEQMLKDQSLEFQRFGEAAAVHTVNLDKKGGSDKK